VRSLAELVPSGYTLVNMSGRIMMTGILESGESMIDLSGLSPGAYILKIGDEKRNSYKLIKD
jgi:ribosomal protein L11 methylase PrmA